MDTLSRNMAPLLLAAFIVSQSGFIIDLKYCVDVFPLENGMMCTPGTMFQRSSAVDFSSPAVSSSNSCCVSKAIEIKHRLKARIAETKPTKALEILASPPSLSPLKILSASFDALFDRHVHSPPISYLIVETSTLLI